MKRFLPLLIILGLAAEMAQAQRLREADDQLDKMVLALELSGPQMAILEMKRELKLNEEQLMQVELLNEERFQRMTEAQMATEDPLQLQRSYREIQVELDKVMAGILNEGQLKHYLELEGRQHVNLLTGKEDDE
ncbi:hypothetical protein [uncultured Pontibacter sp.]|uniref:hypothetical protein n=1 Tax=uncultured Pontibacter sp. TaxID=453356 RepID=UPI002636FC15|nr:hypothetical protein [uncultured Pontibacter sp.]